jgi:hypothetical protein
MLRIRGAAEGFLAPIDDRTELVVDGYPRSGNTFVVAAIHMAQEPGDLRIAHHTHMPAQLLRAVRLGLPAVALIRDPEESVLSLVVRKTQLTAGSALRGWVRFYRPVVPVRDRIVVASFEEAVADVGAIVRRVNDRFGTTFREFEHTREHVRSVQERIERGDLNTFGSTSEAARGGGLPSTARDALKDRLRAQYRSNRLRSLRTRAERLYRALTAHSGAPVA